MKNNGQYTMPSEEKEETKIGKEYKIPMLTDTEKGFISIGVVAGAALAISQKKGMLAILGYMWLGSIAGGGLGYLFKKKEKREKDEKK